MPEEAARPQLQCGPEVYDRDRLLATLECAADGELGDLPNGWCVEEAIQQIGRFDLEPVLARLAALKAADSRRNESYPERVADLSLSLAFCDAWAENARLGAAWAVIRGGMHAHHFRFKSVRASVPILFPPPLFFDLHGTVVALSRVLRESYFQDLAPSWGSCSLTTIDLRRLSRQWSEPSAARRIPSDDGGAALSSCETVGTWRCAVSGCQSAMEVRNPRRRSL